MKNGGERLTLMNLFAFVSNPRVVCRLVSEPRGTISFSLSKQLRKWALLWTAEAQRGNSQKEMKKKWIKMRKIVDRLKLHKRCSRFVQHESVMTKLHFSSTKQTFFSSLVFFSRVSPCFESVLKSEENFRLNYLSIIELHLVNESVCHVYDVGRRQGWVSEGIYIAFSKSIISQVLWNWNVLSVWRWCTSMSLKWKLHFRETFQSMNFREFLVERKICISQPSQSHPTFTHCILQKAINVVLRIICSTRKICMYV